MKADRKTMDAVKVHAVMACLMGAMFWAMFGNPVSATRLFLFGSLAPGQIIKAEDEGAFARFSFQTPDGRTFEAKTRDGGKVGESVRVQFLPHNPDISRTVSPDSESIWSKIWRVLIGWLLAAGLFGCVLLPYDEMNSTAPGYPTRFKALLALSLLLGLLASVVFGLP